jgi:structure-specific endonuclease subunit SLX1
MQYCYILRNTDEKYKNLTYNGYTNNPKRRLRQHNGYISGGAKYTKISQSWEFYVLITGFTNNINALSCEWKIKHPTNSKKRPQKYCGQIGRVKSLNEILHLDKWTSKCTILNSDCNYTVYITNDMYQYLDTTIIPKNFTIITNDKIDLDNIESDKLDKL